MGLAKRHNYGYLEHFRSAKYSKTTDTQKGVNTMTVADSPDMVQRRTKDELNKN